MEPSDTPVAGSRSPATRGPAPGTTLRLALCAVAITFALAAVPSFAAAEGLGPAGEPEVASVGTLRGDGGADAVARVPRPMLEVADRRPAQRVPVALALLGATLAMLAAGAGMLWRRCAPPERRGPVRS